MPPIDEFENALKRVRPQPLSPSVLETLEARMRETPSQRIAPAPRWIASRTVLAGVWTSGFAIGAAAMLLVAPWLGTPPEPSAPSIPAARPQVHQQSVLVASAEEPSAERLVSRPVSQRRDRRYPCASGVLMVGSDPRTVTQWLPIPVNVGSVPDHADDTAPEEVNPNRFRSPVPTTRREWIDQILNEV